MNRRRRGARLRRGRALLDAALVGVALGWSALAACAPDANSIARGAAHASVVDDQQRALSEAPPARRIVALAPHLTDIVVALGASSSLVAVDRHSDATQLPGSIARIASYPVIDPERLLALRPDLILVWGEGLSASALSRLEALGLRVFVSRPRALDDVASSIERIGALVGVSSRAASIASQFRESLLSLTERYARTPAVPVFIQIWETPLITLGSRSVMTDALIRCGVRNVFAAPDAGSQRVSLESVLAAAPRLVISTVAGATDSRWRQLGVVGDSPGAARFVSMVDPALERPSPRVLDSVASLCEAIDAALPR